MGLIIDPYRFGGVGNDAFTKLLLHFDGTNGATTTTDASASANTMTAFGNAQISTAQSKFGGSSSLHDGTGDYWSAPSNADWDFTGDFTIDAWVRHVGGSNEDVIVVRENPGDSTLYICVRASAGQYDCFLRDSGANVIGRITAGSVTTGAWAHLAYVRSGNRFDLYLNGTSIGNVSTATAAATGLGYPLSIGARPANLSNCMNGHIDELRISNGIARWTANFTPPASPYS